MRPASAPSSNGSERDGRGRFRPGNRFGRGGNPHACQVARFRSAFLGAVSEDDVRAVAAELVRCARAGESWAVRELLDRTLGKAEAIDLVERTKELEGLLGEAERRARLRAIVEGKDPRGVSGSSAEELRGALLDELLGSRGAGE